VLGEILAQLILGRRRLWRHLAELRQERAQHPMRGENG
jgi:hypothetical protein